MACPGKDSEEDAIRHPVITTDNDSTSMEIGPQPTWRMDARMQRKCSDEDGRLSGLPTAALSLAR